MAEEDGWCKHFDKQNRACTIYNDRPRFCRVEVETFGDMYGVEPADMDSFCVSCCREQIGDVHGESSAELNTFNAVVAALESGECPAPQDMECNFSPGEGTTQGSAGRGGTDQIRDWGLG
ncbi:unnamed protein product [Discosporangium mesarthrocarpum]